MTTEQKDDFETAIYRAECVCGWSVERDKRAANLPEENNERITRVVASAHEDRPRFGDQADETHLVSFTEGFA